MSVENLRPTPSAFTALVSNPATLRFTVTGDSTGDDNNTGVNDGQSVSAGIVCHYKSTTEYSTTATTTWPVNSGLYTNLCERALLRPTVAAVECCMEAGSASRFKVQRLDQITAAKSTWAAEFGQANAPHAHVLAGLVNDLTANGSGADGEWQVGDALDLASVKRRVMYWLMRWRTVPGWQNGRGVILAPMMENGTYPQTNDLVTWLQSFAALVPGVDVVDVRATRVLLNDKHIDADHPTGGNDMVADAILDVILPEA